LAANTVALEALDSQHVCGVIEDDVYLNGPVVIEEGARLKSGTYIEGQR